MPAPVFDHRALLRENLAAWMVERGKTSETLNARYIQGPKRGLLVSPRSIRNMLSKDPPEGAPENEPLPNSPTYDMIVAVCAALEIMPWHLLVPERGPKEPPRLAATPREIELYAQFERLRAQLAEPVAR